MTMSSSEKDADARPAIDLSHHLSTTSKSRRVSPLKGLQKYALRPGMVRLAGGMPDPAYFPFASISAEALVPDSFPQTKPSESSLFSWFWNMFGAGPKEKSEHFMVPKYSAQKGDVNLATALQYGTATGLQPLQEFIQEFTGKVFKPAYSDWTTLVHIGNTNGLHRAVSTLCDRGERILVEEFTYPSALFATHPMGISPAPVKVDGLGMSAVDLELVLSTWDEKERGAKRPHTMYTIPIGQNPTGATMGLERKKAIYDICVRYDIIIIEDDPYYFLQEGTYYPKELRSKYKATLRNIKGEDDETRWLNSLSPSYVNIDYQGRVIRLDSFSKVIAPGSRMGWFTCNPVFAERLEREGETSTQAPCGFSQALVAQLLSKHWGYHNFVRWLQGLQTQYILRRDFLVDAIYDAFDVRPTSDPALREGFGAGLAVMTAYAKTGNKEMEEKARVSKAPMFSFVPPSAGMFVWLKFHLQDNAPAPPTNNDGEFSKDKIWTDLAEHGLLIAPGWMFIAENEEPSDLSPLSPSYTGASREKEMAFRLSFSMGSNEELKKGVKILAEVLAKYVKL